MTDKLPTASILIIGNEILSGRTQDSNTQHIASKLAEQGIRLTEVRVIPDIKDIIIKTVHEMREKVDYLLTTGGIGPTHDDITTESVAEAFGVTAPENPEARRMLLDYYGSEDQLTEARLKMALIPEGAKLIANPVSGAPGFIIGNVYAMAGVPRIMQAMLDNILSGLKSGPKILSNTVSCLLGESVIAKSLEEAQAKFPDVEIGSYPHYRAGSLGLSIVLRSIDPDRLDMATHEIVDIVHKAGQEPTAISLQSRK